MIAAVPVAMSSLRLADDFKFLTAFTDRATKFCVTGPHSLVKRIKDEYYKNRAGVRYGSGPRDEYGAERVGSRGGSLHSNRRAVLLRIPGRSAVGREGSEYARRRRRCKDRAPCLLRQPVRKAVVGRDTAICSRPFSKQIFNKSHSNSPAAAEKISSCSKNFPTSSRWVSGSSTLRHTKSRRLKLLRSVFAKHCNIFRRSAFLRCRTAVACTFRKRLHSRSCVRWSREHELCEKN